MTIITKLYAAGKSVAIFGHEVKNGKYYKSVKKVNKGAIEVKNLF
jgi:hypothetical protein